MKHEEKIPICRIVGYVFVGILYTLAIVIFVVCDWSTEVFGVGLEEILYTITSPLKGTESGVVQQGLEACLPKVILAILIYIGLVLSDCINRCTIVMKGTIFKRKFKINVIKLLRGVTALTTVAALLASCVHLNDVYDVVGYISKKMNPTTIYEDYYVDPETVDITIAGEKKNLIYIYLESMETTYASEEEGGYQKTSYMPNLSALAEEGVSFSDTDRIGGFHNTTGSGWTMGALLTTTSGVPFSFPVDGNSMDSREKFASGLTTIGDILETFGYNQEFLCGSDANFAGRRTYFEQHGNYEIFDLYTAREEGYIPEDYYVWWGYEDMYLFEIAKKELLELDAKDEPFNFTMLTVDTHHIEGYVCELCDTKYESQTANVVACTDAQVKEFIDWCKEQKFYEETVIVITGDHPRMDSCLVEGIDYYDRTIYNCILNSVAEVEGETTNRIFTALDIFPTVLSSMGYEWDGNRLGLGTDMFSGEQTLAEELGYDSLNYELSSFSNYYLRHFQ